MTIGEDVRSRRNSLDTSSRFRSALRLFRQLLPEAQFAWLNEELRFLTNEMAAARDWDVFAEEIVAPTAQGFPDRAPFRLPQDLISAHRNRSRHTARRIIFSKRYTEFPLRVSAWLTGRVWRDQPPTEDAARPFGPITVFAAGKSAQLHKRLDKAGRKFKALSVPERHRMRIQVKRLRYASDFFNSFYPRKAVKPYSEGLANLQDALGYLNDVAVVEELVARICQGARGEVLEQCRFAGGVIIGWHSRALADSEQRLVRNVKNFIACRPFWPGPA
ncbi:MAG: CHAD domain-containing protein [Rhodospirillales bacterium]|nr:CHAD domain-containing protein [Rhodospirillales bacterium]